MGKVILICGTICSGKSHYANLLKQRERAVILSTDEVTYALTDNAQGEQYDQFAGRVNAYLRRKAVEFAQVGGTVILDWGFWTRENRREITAYFRSHDVAVEWHYVDVDEALWDKHIARRNEAILRGEGGCNFYVDEGLRKKVRSAFEPPEREEMDFWHRPAD